MEHIVDTFTNGIKNFFKNPVLLVPMLIYFLIVLILSTVLGIVIVRSVETNNIMIMAAGIVVFILAVLVLACYFTAGLTGMSKEVVSKGSAKLSDMTAYGNRYAFRVVAANLLLLLLECVILIFWLPAYFAFKNSGFTLTSVFEDLLTTPEALFPLFEVLMLPVLLGLLLSFVYGVILTLVFYFVSYAIVVDDLPVIASFQKSYALLRQNFWKVLLFILVVWALTMILNMALNLFSLLFLLSVVLTFVFSIVEMVLLLVFVTLTAIWITRFYMSETDQPLYTEENLLSTDF